MKKRWINKKNVVYAVYSLLFLLDIGMMIGCFKNPYSWYIAAFAAGTSVALLMVSIGYRKKREFIRRLRDALYEGKKTALYEASGIGMEDEDEKLLDDIIDKINAEDTSRILKTEAELHALQNQINPHFLYNTLEVIRGRALSQHAKDVADMTEALATIFRYNINRPGEMAAFREEIDNVKNYMLIQNYRFGDRFLFETQIEDIGAGILNHLIPVLTLQPLIENAIYHGINEKIQGGKILLKAFLTQNEMIICVEDNGGGMDDSTLREIRKKLSAPAGSASQNKVPGRGSGIALSNVNQRIKFYYGKEYGLDVKSTLGLGTKIIINLPRMIV